MNPERRFGQPHEVARLVAYRLEVYDEAELINGAVVLIGGGPVAGFLR